MNISNTRRTFLTFNFYLLIVFIYLFIDLFIHDKSNKYVTNIILDKSLKHEKQGHIHEAQHNNTMIGCMRTKPRKIIITKNRLGNRESNLLKQIKEYNNTLIIFEKRLFPYSLM